MRDQTMSTEHKASRHSQLKLQSDDIMVQEKYRKNSFQNVSLGAFSSAFSSRVAERPRKNSFVFQFQRENPISGQSSNMEDNLKLEMIENNRKSGGQFSNISDEESGQFSSILPVTQRTSRSKQTYRYLDEEIKAPQMPEQTEIGCCFCSFFKKPTPYK